MRLRDCCVGDLVRPPWADPKDRKHWYLVIAPRPDIYPEPHVMLQRVVLSSQTSIQEYASFGLDLLIDRISADERDA